MKHFRVISLLFGIAITMLTTAQVYGQSVHISVKDETMLPLPGANIRLTRLPDSTTYHRASDLAGVARFDRMLQGNYLVTISYVGFNTLEAAVTIAEGHSDIEYIMTEDAISMNEVIIIARRPLMRMEDDKMIIDTETIAAIDRKSVV